MRFRKGFTLIELLVVVVILSFLGVGIGTCFISGMRLWERIRYGDSYVYDYALGSERLNKDLLYYLPLDQLEFNGKEEELTFVCYESDQLWEITYEYNDMQKELIRKKRSLRAAFDNETSYMISKVLPAEKIGFSYFWYDDEKEEYNWEDSWLANKTNTTLIGVRLFVENKDGTFNKTTIIPYD